VAPANTIHDFHPPIAPSGLYWVAPVPEGGLTVSSDGRTATLEMKNVSVIDQPRWPAYDAAVNPATLSYRLVFKATDERLDYHDAVKQFRVVGYRATAQLEASVEVPSLEFSWKSDPLDTSEAKFAIIGQETNGRYYDHGKQG
jgi:hypothetical protein